MPAQNIQADNKGVYFMMNMPPWYINLSDEEKTRLAEKFAEDSQTDQSLTTEEVADLLRVSDD
jgi:hypothetical protein